MENFFVVPYSIRSFSAIAALSVWTIWPSASSAQTYQVLHNFCVKTNCSDGLIPRGDLLPDGHGGFFGTTESGGRHNEGTVFELTPQGSKWKFNILYSFCARANCTDGNLPNGNLIQDKAGDLYGTAQSGNQGVVFELLHSTRGKKWKIRILYSFCAQTNCTDGSDPTVGLSYAGQSSDALYDGKSPLYGSTIEGGTNNDGVVFELQRNAGKWTETVLYRFCAAGYPCVDGDEPEALLVQGSQNLFGVVPNGGQNEGGAIFEISPGSGGTWNETTIYGFCSASQCTDGETPNGRLVNDAAGNIYGVASSGGTNSAGVLYELTTKGKEIVLHSFCTENECADGQSPFGGLTMDKSGNLFGTTLSGGNENNGGAVFEMNAKFNVLYDFCGMKSCSDGKNPATQMVMDSSGNLFGTTGNGGTGQNGAGGGVAFELTP
ncbi:MAG TPA: choice-of-anchor tandem repeat GloVer-containing protein [Rhizomicrobium sp.]